MSLDSRAGGSKVRSLCTRLFFPSQHSLEVLEVDILWPRWIARSGVTADAIHAGVVSDGRPSVHGVAPSPTAPASSRASFAGVTPCVKPET